jgi:hypothetical protein
MNGETHVDDLELAAFVDGGLDADARRRVEAHLLACDDCRTLVAGTGGLLAQPAHRIRRRVLWIGGLSAAAAALLITVVSEPGDRVPASRTRDVEVVGPAGIGFAPQAPPDGALVRPDTLSFYWTSAGDRATYQLTVSTEAGAIVWSDRTTNTSLALPAAVVGRLELGLDYYWQVDAVLPDLRSASTGPRRFTVMPP